METKKKKFELKALNPMVLICIIIIACAIATYLVPAGQYDRILDPATEREIVDPETFHYVEQNPVGLFPFFMSFTLGLQRAAYVIFFLFMIGGMFQIMEATGAIRNGMTLVVRKMAGKELLMIPVCMVVFGCGSAFAGNFEEFLAFIPLMLGVCLAMGFDSLVAVGIVFCSAASGYAGAMTNAFTVGVAQGIAGLPMFSGMGFRAVVFIALMAVSITYVMLYARKVKKNPQASLVYEFDKNKERDINLDDDVSLSTRQKLVLLTLLGVMVAMVIGIVKFGFYIDELAALFLIGGIIAGVIGGLKPGQMADEFLKGCENLLFAGVMIGLCNAALIIMEDANIMDTIIHALAGLLSGLPPTLSACGMFVVQDVFNVLVPSGSGQAAITMPLMAPLADLIGVSRQTSVLAFQLGDAFTNVMAPTGGELLAACAIAKIPWGKWAKWLFPLFLIWWAVAFIALIVAVKIGYGPF